MANFPYSTTTYVMLLIFAGVIAIALFMFLYPTMQYLTYINNQLSNDISNYSASINSTITTTSISANNMTVSYDSSNYSPAQSFFAYVFIFIASIFLSPIGILILLGISLVMYALFSSGKNNNGNP